MRCSHCGQENPPDVSFCSSCGSRMFEVQTHPPDSGEEPSENGIRPKDLGGLIGETFTIYRQGFFLFLVIAAITGIPSILLAFVGGWWAFPLSILGAILGVLGTAATAYAVAQRYLSGRPDVGECYRFALDHIGPLMGATVLYILMIIGAVLLCAILIGIPLLFYLVVALFFYVEVIVFERTTATGGLGRSRELVRGSWWRVFGIGIVFVLILVGLTLVASAVGIPLTLANETAGHLYYAVIEVLLFPIGAIGATLLYFDLRVRKEGYGFKAMASDLTRSSGR